MNQDITVDFVEFIVSTRVILRRFIIELVTNQKFKGYKKTFENVLKRMFILGRLMQIIDY